MKEQLGEAIETIIREEIRTMLKEYLHLSPDAVAEMLSLGKTTIYEAIHSGELKALKSGKMKGYSVSLQALDDYLSNHQANGRTRRKPTSEKIQDIRTFVRHPSLRKEKSTGQGGL